MKRAHDSLCAPAELPPQELPVVDASLERWRCALALRADLKPVLHREQELIREILSCGLREGDRKTLRQLVTGDSGSDMDALRQDSLVGRMVAQAEKLQGILLKNHNALLELTTRMPEGKEEILRQLDEVRTSLRAAQTAVHGKLLHAKMGADPELVRSLGRTLNDLRALMRRLEADRHEVLRNSRLAALLVTVCRRVLPVRIINPLELKTIDPCHNGYLRILDFYFFSDASKFCFGERYSGPNWFTRLKRNVAILQVVGKDEELMYNDFAVSGVYNKPGAPLAPDNGFFKSIEAEDEHGRVFDRRNDAEFKLLSVFAERFRETGFHGTATLWSKKPLCRSCKGVVKQFHERFPHATLKVVEEEFSLRPTAAQAESSDAGQTDPLNIPEHVCNSHACNSPADLLRGLEEATGSDGGCGGCGVSEEIASMTSEEDLFSVDLLKGIEELNEDPPDGPSVKKRRITNPVEEVTQDVEQI